MSTKIFWGEDWKKCGLLSQHEHRPAAKEEMEVSQPKPSSQGLDPAFVMQDRQQRKSIELKQRFTGLLSNTVGNPSHQQLSATLKEMVQPNGQQRYVQYLVNLQNDLSLLESLLQKSNLSLETLPKLYRAEKIQKDIAFFGLPEEKETKSHIDYFETIKESPELLLCHYSVHILGFLAGGQFTAKGIAKIWGEGGVALYSFSSPANQLRKEFEKEMDVYAATFSNEQYHRFKAEMEKAWAFIIELLNRRE